MVGSALAALGSWLLCPHRPALPDISGHLRFTVSLSWVMTTPSLCRSDPGVSFTSLCHPIFSHCSHFLPLPNLAFPVFGSIWVIEDIF